MDQFEIKKDKSNKFLRPIDKQDVKYRKIKCMKFEEELKSVLPIDCSYCFHGTPIWNAEKIIISGEISSEIDRVKTKEEVLNTPGKIYVSTINNVWFTIKHHADLLNFKYPAGCIFVLLPKDEKEFKSAVERNLISNIDFKKSANRLCAIITTPENINLVKSWLKQAKLDEDLVIDYNAFILKHKEKEISVQSN